MRTFNTAAVCIPSKHYMVDLTSRLEQVKAMVDAGQYFVINRARQYGKTTLLTALAKALENTYTVISLDFQGIGSAGFAAEETFVEEFCRLVLKEKRAGLVLPAHTEERFSKWADGSGKPPRLGNLFDSLTEWCAESKRGIVLLIDEVDSATNNQVFLDFLAQLRDAYITRDAKGYPNGFHMILPFMLSSSAIGLRRV